MLTKHRGILRKDLLVVLHTTSCFNPLTINLPHHKETIQLIWNLNQLTGFYMIRNINR